MHKVSKKQAGYIRLAVLLLAVVNTVLTLTGNSPLPIDDATIETAITSVWFIVAAILSHHYNNPTSKKEVEIEEKKREGLL